MQTITTGGHDEYLGSGILMPDEPGRTEER
jgi:hypothetical protein